MDLDEDRETVLRLVSSVSSLSVTPSLRVTVVDYTRYGTVKILGQAHPIDVRTISRRWSPKTWYELSDESGAATGAFIQLRLKARYIQPDIETEPPSLDITEVALQPSPRGQAEKEAAEAKAEAEKEAAEAKAKAKKKKEAAEARAKAEKAAEAKARAETEAAEAKADVEKQAAEAKAKAEEEAAEAKTRMLPLSPVNTPERSVRKLVSDFRRDIALVSAASGLEFVQHITRSKYQPRSRNYAFQPGTNTTTSSSRREQAGHVLMSSCSLRVEHLPQVVENLTKPSLVNLLQKLDLSNNSIRGESQSE